MDCQHEEASCYANELMLTSAVQNVGVGPASRDGRISLKRADQSTGSSGKNATVVSRLVISQIQLHARHEEKNVARLERLGTFDLLAKARRAPVIATLFEKFRATVLKMTHSVLFK